MRPRCAAFAAEDLSVPFAYMLPVGRLPSLCTQTRSRGHACFRLRQAVLLHLVDCTPQIRCYDIRH